ncbi:MAG TPA: glutathione S-transferase family protein [Stellaceae bacterium]|jgi:glutathione S-transferase
MDEPRIEIFGVPQSNFTRAVRIACEEKAIAYDYHPVRPHSPDVVAIHPLGKIPALRHGELTLAESWPIVSYLDKLFPEAPMIRTGTTALTAEVEQWVSIVGTSVDPVLVRKYVFAYLFPDTPDGLVDRATVEAALPKMEALITMLDARVAGTGFLAAGHFTFADALLLSTLAAVRLYPEGAGAIEAAPNLARYLERHSARPSFVATDPWS